jgi:hypothetical protein
VTDFTPDRSKFRDERGNLITQSLFLETVYDTEKAIYTLSDEDKEYKGRIYPSARRLYLETMDPTEYKFARKYFASKAHWDRIVANKIFTDQVAEWREELEVKIRSEALSTAIAMAKDNFNAAKWIADGSWKGAKPGRPKKEDAQQERRIRERAVDEVKHDAERVIVAMRGKNNA